MNWADMQDAIAKLPPAPKSKAPDIDVFAAQRPPPSRLKARQNDSAQPPVSPAKSHPSRIVSTPADAELIAWARALREAAPQFLAGAKLQRLRPEHDDPFERYKPRTDLNPPFVRASR